MAMMLALPLLAGMATMTSDPAAPVPIVRLPEPGFPIATVVIVPAGATTVYTSGALDPAGKDTEAQTIAAVEDLQRTLRRVKMDLGDIVKMTVFLVGDPAKGGQMDFAGMMAGYRRFFGTAAQPKLPARSTIEVAGLAVPGALVEIEVVAAKAP